MKKWYQPCGWVLLAALALDLSGCAQSSAYLSKITGRSKDDQKLVDVDGKAKKKGTSTAKKSDPAKAADSQLAKKPTKPKVKSSDDSSTELASAKEAAKPAKTAKPATKPASRESLDPFESEEFQALAEKKTTTRNSDTTAKADGERSKEIAANTVAKNSQQGALKANSKAPADVEGSSRIQEVSHKVEDNLADLDDLPDWAAEKSDSSARKESAPTRSRNAATAKSVQSAAIQSDEFARTADESPTEHPVARTPVKTETSEESFVSGPLIDLCPNATGEVRELVRGLNPKDVEGLKRGIHRIGRIGPDAQAAAPALVQLLKHKDGFVKTHAALALARMQASPPEAVQAVVDGLKSTDPGIRSFAAAVLAEMGPQAADALSVLAESLKDRDGYVRLHAAEVLIRYDRWSYEALETLLSGLRDKDENIRWLATYSLAELAPESPETVEALIRASHDRILKVQVGAVYALGEIGPFAKSASGDLRKLADGTPHPELQSAILYALQQIEQ